MTLGDEYVGLRCFSRNNLSASERRPILFFGGKGAPGSDKRQFFFLSAAETPAQIFLIDVFAGKVFRGELRIVRSPRDHINKMTPLFTNFPKLQKFHQRPELCYNLLIRHFLQKLSVRSTETNTGDVSLLKESVFLCANNPRSKRNVSRKKTIYYTYLSGDVPDSGGWEDCVHRNLVKGTSTTFKVLTSLR